MAILPQIQSRTAAAIEAAWEEAQNPRHDATMRCSKIGDSCDRALWMAFRWAREPERFEGRMLRLFETGNIEEDRIVDDLRRIGCQVEAIDPISGRQFEVTFCAGHLTGHTDGEVHKVPEAVRTLHLLEAKSHNEKSFTALRKEGVEKSKPVHYAQMQIYMHGRSLTRALYVAVNKNTDEIYTERVEYDVAFALQIVARAERLIRAPNPPGLCAWCPPWCAVKEAAWSPRNCRTCMFSTPHLDGDARWTCDRAKNWGPHDLTLDEQRVGCGAHRYIPALVPGEQTDVERNAIIYRMADGSKWADEGRNNEHA